MGTICTVLYIAVLVSAFIGIAILCEKYPTSALVIYAKNLGFPAFILAMGVMFLALREIPQRFGFPSITGPGAILIAILFIAVGLYGAWHGWIQATRRFKAEKAAEPGATDNPDDAQRLREDH